VSIIITRQRACLSAFSGKLDFSSREDQLGEGMKPARQTTRSAEEKKSGSEKDMMRENKDLICSWNFS
jgi:hypothetical protein